VLAAAQNRDIQKARAYQQWVQGKYLEERAAALPQATATASVLRNFDNSQSKLFRGFMPGDEGGDVPDIGEIFGGRQEVRSGVLQFSQVLFTWGQVGAAIRAARLGFSYADEQIRQFRQAVAKDVTTAFCGVLVARELLRIAEADLAQKARHLEESTRKQEAGTATDFDVLAAQVSVDNARPSVIRASNNVRLAREQLRFLLAEPGPVDVAGELAIPLEPAPAHDEVMAQALANRPEIGELRAQTGIYGELVTIARAGNKPRLDFSGSWGRRSLGLKTLSSDGTLWTAGIFATIPLFDGMRTRGRVAQARTDLARVSLDELKLRDAISLEVQTALNALEEASEITTALSSTVSQAERLLFLAEKGFELGVKTRLEVQDAELNVLNARANLAVAQRDYRVARVNLQWVTGTLDAGGP
jgi:HAE1 family hydrophobic/amphiphilic exporter-1